MSEQDLSVICQAIPVASDGDVSTQASNIYFGISGIRETFDITTGQPQLYAPNVSQTLNVIDCSNNASNGAFGVVKLYDDQGTECIYPFTADVSYDNRDFTAIVSQEYFLDGVTTFRYLAPVTPTPIVDLSGNTINFISNTSGVTFHAYVNDQEVTLPYTFQNINETITCYGSKSGYKDSQVVSYTYTGLKSTVTTVGWSYGQCCLNFGYATVIRPDGYNAYVLARIPNGTNTYQYDGTIKVQALGRNTLAIMQSWGSYGMYPGGTVGSSYVQPPAYTVKISITNVTKGGITAVSLKQPSTAGLMDFSLPTGTEVGDIVIINVVFSKDPLQ